MASNPRVRELLEHVLDSGLSAEEVCRDCPELLPQVREFWRRHRSIEAQVGVLFPETESCSGCCDPPRLDHIAALPLIPGYDVQAVLGRGGMGVVYKAWHVRLQRTVALKMVLFGDFARPEERERLLREAAAVAGLQHPNIVQVHDVGDHDGRPYFTMEFVEGGSLAQKAAGTPQPAGQAAALVATLAEAVQAAHQNGIVHRDLKPGNILLTADGAPKITDFGLARRLEDSDRPTLTSDLMGTPSYMAPEQANGQRDAIGPGVDVYALGAILYELLTGRPPFRAETATATLQQVLADEPAPPSRLNARVPRDLETICLKCLRKEPCRRYASAVALAEDLRRFGAGEPIRARPVGRLERTVKWARRRPAAAALIAATLLLAVSGGGAALWYIGDRVERRADAQSRSRQINHEANANLDEAEFHLREVRAKLDDPLKVAELLSDMDRWRATVEKARHAWQRASSACASDAPSVMESTRSRLSSVEAALWSEENSFHLAAELDEIASEALTLTDDKSQVQKAATKYAAFFATQSLNVDQDDQTQLTSALRSSSICLVLAAGLDHWAEITALEKTKTQRLARLLELARAADPDPWRDRFRDPDVWRDRAALSELAENVNVEKQSPMILAALALCLAKTGGDGAMIYKRALLSYPRDFWLHMRAASHAKEPAEMVGLYLGALAVRPKSAVTHNNLGVALRYQKDLTGAIAAFKKAIELDPKSAYAHNNLGNALREQQNLPQAIAAFKKAIALNPKSAVAFNNLGIAFVEQKDLPAAIVAFKKAIEIDPTFIFAYSNLGAAYSEQKDLPRAMAVFKKAIELDPKSAQAHLNLGIALRQQKDLPGAVAEFKKTIELDPKYFTAYYDQGNHLHDLNDLQGAIAAYEIAIELNPRFATTYSNLGRALHKLNDLPGAVAAYKKAIELDPKDVGAYTNLGLALRQQKDFPGSIAALKRAIELNPQGDLAYQNLGMSFYGQRQFAEAEKAYLKAIEINPARHVVYNEVAWLLATCADDKARDGKRAVQFATKACELTDWKFGTYVGTLGAAYAETGQFEQAIKFETQALNDPVYKASLGESVRKYLELFEHKKPYRDQ